MGMKTGSRKPARTVALGQIMSDMLGTCAVWVGHTSILYLVLFFKWNFETDLKNFLLG